MSTALIRKPLPGTQVGSWRVVEPAGLGAHGKVMAEDTLPEPQPGQTLPDAKGRCPRKRQVALNGGCWMTLSAEQEECTELRGHLYKGTCYLPYIPPGRPPTSSPADQR